MNALEKAEQLKQELDSLRPLDAEAEARIMQKFRLDWNYHSNNLEGNSLTYGETKALILFGIIAQGKPLKDHFEITGHNEAINWILEIVKDETPLNEKFIRELHTLLLKESSYKEAKTAEGTPTRRKIEVGKYKTQPNHVVTVTGETFYFATPEETPAKMHDLIEWFRNEKEKQGVNPIILAALFHYRFIRIHPFDDGNGRTARILMNFILMQFGYPPVIIKTEDKENYFAVLRLADADRLEPFIDYIAQNLVHSLEIMIRGAKGESIEEPEDLDKELALLERAFEAKGNKIEKFKTTETIKELLKLILPDFLQEFIYVCQKFDRFYLDSSLTISIIKEGSENSVNLNYFKIVDLNRSFLKSDKLSKAITETVTAIIFALNQVSINILVGIEFKYDYKTVALQDIYETFAATLLFEFDEKTYLFTDIAENNRIVCLYSETPNKIEISEVIRIEAVRHKKHLEEIITQDSITDI